MEKQKAISFLSGAKHCISQSNDLNLGTYLLHQATELMCRAILTFYLDYDVYGHSLFLLLRHAHRMSDNMGRVLSDGTPEENSLLNLLSQSYFAVRYTNSFSITSEEAKELLKRVTVFINIVNHAYSCKMKEFEEKFIK